MNKSHEPRLIDMLQNVEIIQELVTKIGSFRRYDEDRPSQMVVERGLEIVSEASRHLPTELKQRHPDIPWKNIQDIGNKLRHEYQRITQFVLWETARLDLPPLLEVCRVELEREQQAEQQRTQGRTLFEDRSQGRELKRDG